MRYRVNPFLATIAPYLDRGTGSNRVAKRAYVSQRTPGEQKATENFDNKMSDSKGKVINNFPALQKIRWKIIKGGTFTQAELATMAGLAFREVPHYIAELRRQGLLIKQEEPYAGRRQYWMDTPPTWKSVGEIINF